MAADFTLPGIAVKIRTTKFQTVATHLLGRQNSKKIKKGGYCMLKSLFNSASVAIIGAFLFFALTALAFATVDPEDMEKIISVADLVNQLQAPITVADQKSGKIAGVLESSGPGRVLMKDNSGNIILRLEFSGSAWIAWDAGGNRYEGGAWNVPDQNKKK